MLLACCFRSFGFGLSPRRQRRQCTLPLPPGLLMLALMLVVGAKSAEAEDDTVYLFGSQPARPASFGLEFVTASDANRTNSTVMNVMYPPRGSTVELGGSDDVSHSRTVRALCQFTSDMADAAALTASDLDAVLPSNDEPIGFLVELRGCSAQKQAQVAGKMRRLLSDKIQYLIIQGDPTDGDRLKKLVPIKDDLLEESIGILYVSFRTGFEIRHFIRSRYEMWPQGLSPLFLDPSGRNKQWTLHTGVERIPRGGLPSSSLSPLSSSDSGGYGTGWYVLLAVTLLFVSLCLRLLFLWWLSGGRIRIRRDGRGRVRGIRYVAPRSPDWLSWGTLLWWSPANVGAAPQQNQDKSMLTEEEFGSLPEIVFADADTDAEAEDADPEKHPHRQESGTTGDDDPSVFLPVARNAANLKAETGTSEGGAEGGEAVGEESAPLDKKTCPCPDPQKAAADENSLPVEAVEEEKDQDQDQEVKDIGNDGPSNPLAAEEVLAESTTSCSKECSICIEDFTPGERLTLLPRCQHAFHRGCIHPWLTERQGCCPLCKTNVLVETHDDRGDVDDGGGRNQDVEAAEAGTRGREATGDVEEAGMDQEGEEGGGLELVQQG